MSTGLNRKISEFEDMRVRYQGQMAIQKLQDQFEQMLQLDDGLHEARDLVGKIYLLCGDRRTENVRVANDRRY